MNRAPGLWVLNAFARLFRAIFNLFMYLPKTPFIWHLTSGPEQGFDAYIIIYKQLKEIESFKQRIDELLAGGYNPILDDGVGKNIAPLQKKKMIAYEVLNSGQLKKYLNADW